MISVQDPKRKTLNLDPRTKLLMTFSIGLITVLSGISPIMELIILVMAFIPPFLFLSVGKIRRAVICVLLYGAAALIVFFLVPLTDGFVKLMLSAICAIFQRFMPVIAMAWYMLDNTKVSEFVAAMEKMHISQKIIIPFSVVFRFFPTVKEEASSINDAMKMRGIQFGGGNPSSILEYRLIPMIICTVKIGEELSAAALTRGLGAPIKRTNICKIGIRIIDICFIVLCITAVTCLVLNRLGVL